MRDAFSTTLVQLAKADPKVLLITGDHGYALFDEFRRECPGQYINAGIAEQNMVGMAAGLARLGFRPFVYGLSAFVPIRVLEQLKLDIAHDNLPVVLLGDGAGFVYSYLGTSHQSTEDIACARAIPSLMVLSPADRYEMAATLKQAYASSAPVYLRMGKADRGDVHCSEPDITAGKLVPVQRVTKGVLAIIATGSMVATAKKIAADKDDWDVWSAPTIKSLNVEMVERIAKTVRGIAVIEEHSVYGGLGSAISEIVSALSGIRVLRIGVKDKFSDSCGSYEHLLQEHKLDLNSVYEEISKFYAETARC